MGRGKVREGERLRGSVERNGPNCATTDLTEFVYSLGHIRFCTHDSQKRVTRSLPGHGLYQVLDLLSLLY